jgi:DNA-binding transcriptional LysR family regulator
MELGIGRGEVAVGVEPERSRWPGTLDAFEAADPLVVALRPGHPLARKRGPTPADLEAHPIARALEPAPC